MSLITDIADAVAVDLNAGSFSLPFTAVRRYVPRFNLQEMETLRVSVVPKGLTITTASRKEDQHEVRVDIGVQKKFDQGDNAELDPLMALVEEIADFFRSSRLDTTPPATCVAVENAPIYAQEHFAERRLFTSVVTLTFRCWR